MEFKGVYFTLKDTNIANLGSALEKAVKLEAAQKEDQWNSMSKEPGIQIWRIEKFKVVPWPKNEYGSFYSGDSYIVLHTSKSTDGDLLYEAHMWVGTFTTQDEAGTAAYKIVELDDFLGRNVVLHRQVQGYESDKFLSYFKVLTIMDGGVETGFRSVPIENYKPRLLHISGRKDFRIVEVPLSCSSLNCHDVFLLDNGLTLYSWRGEKANPHEKFKIAMICESIKSERNGKPKVISMDEEDENDDFWNLLGGKGDIHDHKREDVKGDKRMMRISDSTGEMKIEDIEFDKKGLSSDDVFVVDAGHQLYVWIGKSCSMSEKVQSVGLAHKYLRISKRPMFMPVTCMNEGRETLGFEKAFE